MAIAGGEERGATEGEKGCGQFSHRKCQKVADEFHKQKLTVLRPLLEFRA
jgi:hypothetical protein